MNQNDFRNVTSNITFNIYVLAFTQGLKSNYKTVAFNIWFPYINQAPVFAQELPTGLFYEIL